MSKGFFLLSHELGKLFIVFSLLEKPLSFSLDCPLLAHSNNTFIFIIDLDNLVFVNCETNSFESFLLHKHLQNWEVLLVESRLSSVANHHHVWVGLFISVEHCRHEVSNVVKEEKVLEHPEDSHEDEHHHEEEWSVGKVGLELIVQSWDHFLTVG